MNREPRFCDGGRVVEEGERGRGERGRGDASEAAQGLLADADVGGLQGPLGDGRKIADVEAIKRLQGGGGDGGIAIYNHDQCSRRRRDIKGVGRSPCGLGDGMIGGLTQFKQGGAYELGDGGGVHGLEGAVVAFDRVEVGRLGPGLQLIQSQQA